MSRADEPELSLRAVTTGLVLGAILAAAGLYVGQKTGGGDSGHIPASIVGFAILSALGRSHGRGPAPRETSIVQTIASSAAMMSLTGGFIGPLAALVLAGESPPAIAAAAWGAALGIAACVIAIPLRAAFVARDGLPFPGAVATAAVIETLHAGAGAAADRLRWLAIGAAIALAAVAARQLGWIPGSSALPVVLGALPAAAVHIGIEWSPMLAATGVIAGARVGVALVLGTAVAWLVLAPILVGEGLVAGAAYGPVVSWLVWPGVGLMIGGTLAGLVSGWSTLDAGLRELRGAAGTDELRGSRGLALTGLGAAIAVVALGRLAFGVHPAYSALALAAAVPLCAAAARAKGETDRTPAGPLGALGQLVTGIAAPGGLATPLCGGGIVNGTAMQSSMMVTNWRIGRAVGARPGAQLAASIAGIVIGATAAAAAFELVRRAYGLGNATMPATAGQSWKATAEVVQHGLSAMPAYASLAAALGLALGLGTALAARHRRLSWLPSPVAFGMAFITPAAISLAIAAGAILFHPVARRRGPDVTLLAAGVIAGEALAGLAIAAWIVASG